MFFKGMILSMVQENSLSCFARVKAMPDPGHKVLTLRIHRYKHAKTGLPVRSELQVT